MAAENGHNNAPDSWDQDDTDDSTQSGQSLSKLNANAPAFIPGKNPYAAEFVPTFGNTNNQGKMNICLKDLRILGIFE